MHFPYTNSANRTYSVGGCVHIAIYTLWTPSVRCMGIESPAFADMINRTMTVFISFFSNREKKLMFSRLLLLFVHIFFLLVSPVWRKIAKRRRATAAAIFQFFFLFLLFILARYSVWTSDALTVETPTHCVACSGQSFFNFSVRTDFSSINFWWLAFSWLASTSCMDYSVAFEQSQQNDRERERERGRCVCADAFRLNCNTVSVSMKFIY